MKLFLSDLDGTLMDVQGTIHEDDLQAIQKLQEHGIAFGIVTGRDVGFCRRLIQRYALPKCDIIGNNGGSIWIGGSKVMEEHIAAKDTLEIMEFLKNHLDEVNPFVCNEEGIFYLMKDHYTAQKWEEVKETLAYLGTISSSDLLDYLKAEQEPIVKISIHTYTKEGTDAWLPVLRDTFGKQYEILPTSFDYIEITRKGIDKGKSLLELLKLLHVKRDEVAVIGDGANDISLFHEVPMSFAMASAEEYVQKEAAHVVKSVAEAVAFVIE